MQFGATYCTNFQENLLKIFNISERIKRCFRPSIVGGGGGKLTSARSDVSTKELSTPQGPDSHSYS